MENERMEDFWRTDAMEKRNDRRTEVNGRLEEFLGCAYLYIMDHHVRDQNHALNSKKKRKKMRKPHN